MSKKSKKTEPVEIKVGETYDPASLLSSLNEARRDEIIKLEKRSKMARDIAGYRWALASTVHRLQDGKTPLDLKSRPFQVEILQDEAIDIVVFGSAQWGKSEIIICHAIACAALGGLKVLWVTSKEQKRNKFVSERLWPILSQVPAYSKLLKESSDRGAATLNKGLTQIGFGSLNFIYSTSESEFTSHVADSCLIDEMQECDMNNLKGLFSRMLASDYGLMMRVGHPDVTGTEENSNLDYFYQNSDRRVWMVPCPFCKMDAELDWWNHCIAEKRNRTGGIISVRPRDEEWKVEAGLDMRPICTNCHRPMYRFAAAAHWKPLNPGHPRHGYQLGSLYNPSAIANLTNIYEQYLLARHEPHKMREFVNKILGKPHDISAERLTSSMLANCASGEGSGVAPYRFIPATRLDWTNVLKKEREMAA